MNGKKNEITSIEQPSDNDLRWLNHYLRMKARDYGLCDEWFGEWKEENDSLQQLIDKFIKGLDFCLEHDYPSVRFIKEYFPVDLLRENGILADDRWSLLNPKYAVLLGNSESTIRLNGYTVSAVYLKGVSTARIHLKDNCHLIVHVYEDAGVHIACDNNKKMPLVILHGGISDERVSYEIGGGVGIQIKREE